MSSNPCIYNGRLWLCVAVWQQDKVCEHGDRLNDGPFCDVKHRWGSICSLQHYTLLLRWWCHLLQRDKVDHLVG